MAKVDLNIYFKSEVDRKTVVDLLEHGFATWLDTETWEETGMPGITITALSRSRVWSDGESHPPENDTEEEVSAFKRFLEVLKRDYPEFVPMHLQG
jgi:hypothetical protein